VPWTALFVPFSAQISRAAKDTFAIFNREGTAYKSILLHQSTASWSAVRNESAASGCPCEQQQVYTSLCVLQPSGKSPKSLQLLDNPRIHLIHSLMKKISRIFCTGRALVSPGFSPLIHGMCITCE
jgi:hypothetical protein